LFQEGKLGYLPCPTLFLKKHKHQQNTENLVFQHN